MNFSDAWGMMLHGGNCVRRPGWEVGRHWMILAGQPWEIVPLKPERLLGEVAQVDMLADDWEVCA